MVSTNVWNGQSCWCFHIPRWWVIKQILGKKVPSVFSRFWIEKERAPSNFAFQACQVFIGTQIFEFLKSCEFFPRKCSFLWLFGFWSRNYWSSIIIWQLIFEKKTHPNFVGNLNSGRCYLITTVFSDMYHCAQVYQLQCQQPFTAIIKS